MLSSRDGLLKNMLISGNTQGVTQLVSSISSSLARQAAQEKVDEGGDAGTGKNKGSTVQGGDSLEDSEAKKARIQVCKRNVCKNHVF